MEVERVVGRGGGGWGRATAVASAAAERAAAAERVAVAERAVAIGKQSAVEGRVVVGRVCDDDCKSG